MLLLLAAYSEPEVPVPPTAVLPPTNLQVIQTNAKSVAITWTASISPSEPPTALYYKIYLNGVWDGERVPAVLKDTVLSELITGLTPNTTYSIYVVAVDSSGLETEATDTVSVTTSRNTDSGIFKGFRKRMSAPLNKGMYG